MAGKDKSSANSGEPRDTIEDGLRLIIYDPTVKQSKKRGRPRTEYQDEWCDLLVEHMQNGNSFESFAGKIGIGRTKLYEFLDEYPEFADTKKIGESASLLWWENAGRALAIGKFPHGKAAVWAINVFNRFPHLFKRSPEPITVGDKNKPDDVSGLSDEELISKTNKFKDIGNVDS